ncbi:hypothetical protein D7V86_06850 [bacterium D16-51]|nr:hypothetical protein D7V96_07280 [bacterium D16-59]RKI61031.1 hypothetical protein D7V86_06850 [bacterium D16-51]
MERITMTQEAVMKVFWEYEDRALSASEIVKLEPSLNLNTVRACVKVLLEKNYIVVDDVVYSNTVLARAYRPIISIDRYISENFEGTFGSMPTIDIVNQLLERVTDASVLDEALRLIAEIKKRRNIK